MIYFTSDLHLNHEKIAIFTDRPFKRLIEHDDAIIEGINLTVGEDDKLFILGDVSWRPPGAMLDRMVCQDRHLIWGNHDRANYAKDFRSAEDVAEIKIGEDKIWLSHYAHAYWPASHRGSYHLYGHTHMAAEEELDRIWPERRSMDVGVDNAFRLLGSYRPFSWDEILQYLRPRKGHHQVSGKSWNGPNADRART